MGVRIGVVVFPGSNCDRDTVHALELAGAEPVVLWHEQASLDGRRRGRPARRLRLRRLPARRGHRPVQPGHARGDAPSPPTAGSSSASATASRSSPRPGSCPGALLRNALAAVRGPARSRSPPSALDTPFTHALDARAGRCACRSPTARAATTPTTPTLDALERDGQVLFRYVDADGAAAGPDDRPTRTARCARSPGSSNARRQRGRAHAAPGARRRGDPRLGRRAGDHPLARRERGARPRTARPAVAVGGRDDRGRAPPSSRSTGGSA